jgi:hypothetical protein
MRHSTRMLAAWLVAAMVCGGPGQAGAALEVVVSTGQTSPRDLPYSGFVGIGLGDANEMAVLAQTSGVFRRVLGQGGTPAAQAVFAPGSVVAGKTMVGAGPPVLETSGCVLSRLEFLDGDEAVMRGCEAGTERVIGVGDAVDARSITSLDAVIVASPNGHVAVLARLSDGNLAVVRTGVGPTVEIAATGDSSPAGGIISSLRLIGVRSDGVVGFGATVVDGRDGLFEGDGVAVERVIVEGGTSLDGIVTSIEGASMNADGVFAFVGELDDQEGTRGIFRGDARPVVPQVSLIVPVGTAAPGVEGGTFGRFPPSLVPSINLAGAVAFRVTLAGDASGAGVFVAEPAGGVRNVVTTRDDELAVGRLTRLRDPVIADDGSVLVVATPPSEGVGLFVARAGEVGELIRFGAPADVGAPDQMFRFVAPSVTNDAWRAVFLGQHDVLLAIDAAGEQRISAQLGAPAPGGGVFSEIDVPACGDEGRIAFRGEMLDGKIGQGVFVDTGSGPVVIAKSGKQAPGKGRFRDFPAAVIDNGGSVDVAGTRVAFLASLFDSNAIEGIFLRKGRSGGKALARTNARAPGGGRYVSIDTPTVMDAKHHAFSALVRDESTRQGIFWRDGKRTRIVARQTLETGSRIGGRFQAFSPPSLAAGGLLFRADVSPGGRDALFLGVETRRGLLLAAGDPDDAAGTFRTFDRPVWTGSYVAFSGSLAGVPPLRGLFRLLPDGLPAPDAPPRPVLTVLREGWAAPNGGAVADVRPPVGNALGTIASIVRVEGGPAQQIVVRVPLE